MNLASADNTPPTSYIMLQVRRRIFIIPEQPLDKIIKPYEAYSSNSLSRFHSGPCSINISNSDIGSVSTILRQVFCFALPQDNSYLLFTAKASIVCSTACSLLVVRVFSKCGLD